MQTTYCSLSFLGVRFSFHYNEEELRFQETGCANDLSGSAGFG
jgi:hypothetical protein